MPGVSRLTEIRERGYLRVGYFDGACQFLSENKAGKLVRIDVEMAYRLAQNMKVSARVRAHRARTGR